MNPAEIQKIMQESSRMMNDMFAGPFYFPTRVMMWSQANPGAAWAITIVYFAIWLQAIWHCLRSHTGADRTTWLVLLLFLPLFGIIFYWSIANQSGPHNNASVYRPAPPAPPAPTTRNIADEITADLAKRKRP
ncbi:MAG TPA: PLDc N-terminal domain-containing protein [Rariglobus sp.]